MRISRAIYRVLLRLCPQDLRRQFGADMEALFLADLRSARGLSQARVWARAIADIARHGVGARNDRWNRARRASAYVEYEGGGSVMETWRYDLRHAMRANFARGGTTAIVVLTLALAIGANTAVFSVVHAVLLAPLPYAEPDRLVQIHEKRAAEGVFTNPVSPADYIDWAERSESFTNMAAYAESGADLTNAGEPERFVVAGVTTNFFETFGVMPLHGRTFRPGEDAAGRNRVVVLDHALWQQRFGGDPALIGQAIRLNDLVHEVIGVLPPRAHFPFGEPLIYAPLLVMSGSEPPPRASHYLSVYARLRPGVPLEQARAEMDRIGRDLETQHPQISRGHGSHVVPLAAEMVKGVRGMLLVLMAAVVFILLIACVNVTNLLLAAAEGRRREIAVRSAIGGSRARLIRQMLTETSLLAFAGGAAGITIAWWGVQLLAAQMPAAMRPESAIVFSVPVLLFTAITCIVSGLLAGALPAWQLVREDLAVVLNEGGRGPVSLRRRLRFGLIVVEIAAASLLLVGAGLMLRSFQRVLLEPAGFETASRLTFNVRLPRARYAEPAALDRFVRELQERLAAEPSAKHVGATSALPLTGVDGRNGIDVDGYERGTDDPPTRAHPRAITLGYLSAAGIRLAAGRGFGEADRTGPSVVVINEAMARRYWRGRPALGGRMRFTQESEWREVVGIIADVKHWGLEADVNPEVYLPFERYRQSSMSFVIETMASPLALVPVVQHHVRQLDANLPISSVRTFEEVAARSVEQRRFTMLLLGCFAVLALVLAAAGIYGVMSHMVTLRTPEIGVRLTLGAKPEDVMRQVVGEGVRQAAAGLAIGLGASLAMMRGLRTILFGIEPTDPVTLVSVAVALMSVALLAVALPAWRAMRVDPAMALKK